MEYSCRRLVVGYSHIVSGIYEVGVVNSSKYRIYIFIMLNLFLRGGGGGGGGGGGEVMGKP